MWYSTVLTFVAPRSNAWILGSAEPPSQSTSVHELNALAMIAEIIADRPASEWLVQLEAAGIPAGPINSISQALADPQVIHRGARITSSGGALGEVPMVGNPIRLDGQRTDAPLPPPALGEHGNLLKEWADDDELARLRAAGIIS